MRRSGVTSLARTGCSGPSIATPTEEFWRRLVFARFLLTSLSITKEFFAFKAPALAPPISTLQSRGKYEPRRRVLMQGEFFTQRRKDRKAAKARPKHLTRLCAFAIFASLRELPSTD